MINNSLRRLGVAELLLVLSIFILVIVVAVPILLIFGNAFFTDQGFNLKTVIQLLSFAHTP